MWYTNKATFLLPIRSPRSSPLVGVARHKWSGLSVTLVRNKLAASPSTGKLRGNVCNGFWACERSLTVTTNVTLDCVGWATRMAVCLTHIQLGHYNTTIYTYTWFFHWSHVSRSWSGVLRNGGQYRSFNGRPLHISTGDHHTDRSQSVQRTPLACTSTTTTTTTTTTTRVRVTSHESRITGSSTLEASHGNGYASVRSKLVNRDDDDDDSWILCIKEAPAGTRDVTNAGDPRVSVVIYFSRFSKRQTKIRVLAWWDERQRKANEGG